MSITQSDDTIEQVDHAERPTALSNAESGLYGWLPEDGGELHRRLRRTRNIRLSKLSIAAGDLASLTIAAVIAYWLKARYSPGDPTPTSSYVLISLVSLPVWLMVLNGRRLYESRFISRRMDEIRRILDSVLIVLVALIVLDFVLAPALARTWVVVIGVTSTVALVGFREIVRQVFRHRRRKGLGLRRVVIVGDNDEALGIESMIDEDPNLGYETVARVVQRPSHDLDEVRSKLLDDTLQAVRDNKAHGVIVAITSVDSQVCNQLVRALAYSGVHLELTSALSDISADRLSMRPVGRHPMVYIEPVQRFGWRPVTKRIFDMAVAGSLLLLTAPLLGVVALLVKVTSPGPALFRQERVGRGGDRFEMFKFRTMVVDAEDRLAALRERNEADGPLFKLTNDPRVTRIGAILRKSSIDELPQLWNVLKGEMSLVGPRPALPSEAAEWSIDLGDRLRVRPGMTGMWQVSGRSEASFDEYTRLDLYYVDNWSLLIDLGILVKTVPALLARRGAH